MRKALKFFHTIGAIGLMGAMASLLVLIHVVPPPQSLAAYASTRAAMGAIATWIFFPSLGLTLIAGLLAIAVTNAYHNAGWAWVKAATGILVFEACFVGVLGPMQREAEPSAKALAGELDTAGPAQSRSAQRNTLLILLALSAANVILGIWRPRFSRRKD